MPTLLVVSIARGAALAALLLATIGPAMAQPAADATRGRLLYETHCVACHNTQIHWRDARLATDWAGLRTQVQAWQSRANLGWSADDVTEVARHLNDSIYRFEAPTPPRSALPAVIVASEGRSPRR